MQIYANTSHHCGFAFLKFLELYLLGPKLNNEFICCGLQGVTFQGTQELGSKAENRFKIKAENRSKRTVTRKDFQVKNDPENKVYGCTRPQAKHEVRRPM